MQNEMNVDVDRKTLILSVGELSRLVADSADTSLPISFSLRGRVGAEAHRAFQNQRGKSAGYRREVHLNVSLVQNQSDARGWEILVRGRLDGLIEELDRLVVEELKTVAMPPNRFSSLSSLDFPRHRRQLEIYLHLLSLTEIGKTPVGKLIYINLPTGKKRSLEIPYNRNEIEPLVWDHLAALIDQEVRRSQEQKLKSEFSAQLEFPFKSLRPGQEEIISSTGQILTSGSNFLLEAPTGLGKTAAVLYAAVRYALEHNKRIIFLTSKTTQQDLVYETAGMIRGGHPFPRTLLLRARQKLCPRLDYNCRPEECPYLEDFNHRFRRSRVQDFLLRKGAIHPDEILEAGRRQELCPHELQLALIEDVDLIIGDYNYAFDPGCRLEKLFESGDPSRLILIVDEAHNLPDRARSYYSAKLPWSSITSALEKLNSEDDHSFDSVIRTIQEQFEYYLKEAPPNPNPYPISLSLPIWEKIGEDFDESVIPYWYRLANEETDSADNPVLTLHKELENFLRCLNLEGDNFAHLLRRGASPELEILCLDGSPFLKQDFSSVHAAVLMSATLQPFDAYRRLLGLDENATNLALPSPFPPEHCRLFVDSTVTTLYRERDSNIVEIADRIQCFHSVVDRSVLAFFPSFDLMRRITDYLEVKKLLLQEEGMTDAQRSDLLKAFKRSRRALLCSVMGGVFGEGIDLPGQFAEAAVIVGVGLPQVCTENELMRAYFDRCGENGFDFAYLYPGMRRVIQAVGRVIRSETDRGIILLLDRRFTERDYQRLFPRHWYANRPDELIQPHWESEIRELAMSTFS